MAKWEEPAIMGLKRISRAERAGLAPLSCFRGLWLLSLARGAARLTKIPIPCGDYDGFEILPRGMAGKALRNLIEQSAFPGAKLTVGEMRFWDTRRRGIGSSCCLKTGPA